MMVSSSERGAEGDDSMQSEDEPDLDNIAQRVQNLFKYEKF